MIRQSCSKILITSPRLFNSKSRLIITEDLRGVLLEVPLGILMEDLGALLEEIFVTTVERGFHRLHEEDGVEDHHLGTTEEVVVEDVGEDEIISYLYVISYQKKNN